MSLSYQQEPLNEILLDLNDRFAAQVSINSTLSGGCLVSIENDFKSLNKALQALAKACQLELRLINEVYVFREEGSRKESLEGEPSRAPKPKKYLYQGIVVEAYSQEPVPYATIQIDDFGLNTDAYGRFTFQSASRTAFVSYRSLGYQSSDTLLRYGNQLVMPLQAATIELEEVIVDASKEVPQNHIGRSAGQVQFNDINNRLIPGLGYDLIFNHLRLYPGIMAAGESVADFVIWGSYAGQNHVLYDGISLFSNWGTYADIGRINPNMIKDVELYKGGYNVPIGDRVGGVVMVEGKSGDLNRVRGELSVSNQLANARISVPLFNHSSSLQVAGRVTYFDFLDLSAQPESQQDVLVPEYNYADLNIKFSSNLSPSDKLEISSIASWDTYDARLRSQQGRGLFEEIRVRSVQLGGSLKYAHNWKKGGLSTLTLARSNYEPELNSYFVGRQDQLPTRDTLRQDRWSNPIEETSVRLTHTFPVGKKQRLELSGAYIHNKVMLESRTAILFQRLVDESLGRLSFYLHDKIFWTDWFSMELGLKADFPTTQPSLYLQPRVNGTFSWSKHWRATLGWGLYNQFISKNSLVDPLGNQTDFWQVVNDQVPALESMHNVLGISYLKDGLEIGLEGYYKSIRGFSRFFLNRDRDIILATGQAKAYGLDAIIRKQFGTHEVLLSYSLGQVKERFERVNRTTAYAEAPQSQRHEVKGALVLDFSPFRISATQVYGSGFPNTTIERDALVYVPYWRTDLALQYEHQIDQMTFAAGLSILNVFNQENVRLNQSVSIPEGDVINTVGIPFTPAIYLNFSF